MAGRRKGESAVSEIARYDNSAAYSYYPHRLKHPPGDLASIPVWPHYRQRVCGSAATIKNNFHRLAAEGMEWVVDR